VRRVVSLLAGVLFLAAVTPGWAQTLANASSEAVPAADHSEIECSGYVSASPVSNALYIDGGPDNDFLDRYHGFATGDHVFLHIFQGTGPAVGQIYRLVRPISETASRTFFRGGMGDMPTFGYISWYPFQNWDIHKLGQPYADIGRVKIIKLTDGGVVAKVIFACVPANIGDLAVPYQPRPIPTYTPAEHPDRFALSNGKKTGTITAVKNNFESVGTGGIVYLNLGQSDNVQAGTRFRAVRVLRLQTPGLLTPPTLPHETVGEIVVLWTQEKSSVGIVVRAIRDIDAGDAVQME
jgi:hypothetical protein